MIKKILEKAENNTKENTINLEQDINQLNLEKKQNSFLKSNLGKAINAGVDIGLKTILPDCVEDEVISIKDSLITEGFSAAVDTAIEEATNLGKSLMGILTGSFENVSQIKEAVEKGGLIDTISDLLGEAIDWAKKKEYINKSTASAIKKGKNAIMDTIEDGIEDTFSNQIKAIEKIDGYIEKWQKYYEQQNFTNMEYQYDKIQEYLQEVVPLESVLEKARIVENLHELIKNNGKDFNLSEEQKELAEILS